MKILPGAHWQQLTNTCENSSNATLFHAFLLLLILWAQQVVPRQMWQLDPLHATIIPFRIYAFVLKISLPPPSPNPRRWAVSSARLYPAGCVILIHVPEGYPTPLNPPEDRRIDPSLPLPRV
jgi:hypothetical protein